VPDFHGGTEGDHLVYPYAPAPQALPAVVGGRVSNAVSLDFRVADRRVVQVGTTSSSYVILTPMTLAVI